MNLKSFFSSLKTMMPCLFLFSSNLKAEEQEFLFESTRAYGRGRTYVAAPDSDEAVRLNPSTLADSKIDVQIRYLEGDIFIGDNTVSTISDILEVASTTDGVGFLRKFDDKFGEKQYLRMQMSMFSLRLGSFELSPVGFNASWLELKRPPFPYMRWQSDTVVGLNASYAYNLNNEISLGVTLRPLYRWYIAGEISFTDIIDFLPPAETKFEDVNPLVSGFSLGADLAMTWKPSKNFRWGLLFRNVGDASYTQKTGKQPPILRQVISSGIFYRMDFSTFDIDYYFDLQDIVNRDGLNLTRLTHFGVELGKSVFTRDHDFGVTMGLNEGYVTGGLFADLYIFRLDYVNYAVETGHNPGQNMDRRWAVAARTTTTF